MSIYQEKEYWNSFKNMIPNNEIWYTNRNGNVVTPKNDYGFGASIVSNTYTNGKGIIKFDGIVTSIGNGSFSACYLESIVIPNSVTSIGRGSFRACYLESIVIPNSVTSIGSEAFAECHNLKSIVIPNSVTSIEEDVFSNCTSLPIENNLRYADTYLIEAFGTGLSTYTIKEGTRFIGSEAFSGCKYLKSIVIPNSVTSIGIGAFYGCSSLTSVTTKATTPPKCGNYSFGITSADTLIVPVGCVLTYKKADVWRTFGTITDGEVQFPKITIAVIGESTQSTIKLKLNYNEEDCIPFIPFDEMGVELDGIYYKANSEGFVILENLRPNAGYAIGSYVKIDGEYYYSGSTIKFSTKGTNPQVAVSDIMANSVFVRGVFDIGDAHVYKTTIYVGGKELTNSQGVLNGLNPNTKYEVSYHVYYHYGENDEQSDWESCVKDFTTAELKMTTLAPRNVSSTSSVVAAEANISDDETGVGFEWRKFDAPESLPSSSGKAVIFDGRMEGKINNLQPVYYKVRPYYESASGNRFYGDWITFDPTDFSYFEPTVHTYDFVDAPSTNAIEVRGYVMQGTDDVTEQGFEYWKTGGATRGLAADGVMRVQATGQLMVATLKDLDYESSYAVRAYVVTAGGTTYGEERTFTTPVDPASGISAPGVDENVSATSHAPQGIYTLNGQKIDRITSPGIYIRNGKKILVRQDQLPME